MKSTVTAAALRSAGRHPPVPLQVALVDGSALCLHQLLRVLPGKRIVGIARHQGRPVLAKLFIARSSARHWQREADGIAALHEAGLPTPLQLAASPLRGGGHVLLTEFIPAARSLAADWEAVAAHPPADAAALALLRSAFHLLGRLHARGLVQDDLHLGNFLRADESGELLLIDGDAVRAICPGEPLPAAAALDNFALLAAQLPPRWDAFATELEKSWHAADARLPTLDEQAVHARIDDWRARRLADYLAKSRRDCSLFRYFRRGPRHLFVVRSEAERLAPLLADPDGALAGGKLLKDGNTCTVAKVNAAGAAVVIKRYNIKHPLHALSRAWRPSRAARAWRAGHRLHLLDIPTPAPLAMIEERAGPLRRRAWLLTAWSAGIELAEHLAPYVDSAPPPATAQALIELFASLQRYRLSHGDLKANNLLWQDGRIVLIDLDAMRQHRSRRGHARAWRRDRARLLRNWPPHSALWRWLDEHLPPA